MSAHPSHRVQLDAYAGPMDLLLYLVKRHEIDLHDIPMAELVEQYLAHLRVIETIDVESAGEFLVMAATLVEIKSRMIMPPALRGDDAPEDEQGDAAETLGDSGVDPRFELVQQLLAYKRFKDAALALEERAESWDARFPASAKFGQAAAEPDPEATDAPPADLDLEDVNVLDLCAAFGRVMEGIGHLGNHKVTYDDTPISLHADDIADRLARDGGPRKSMTLRALFTGRHRDEMIGLFLATLELVRQRKVKVMRGEEAGNPDQIELQLQPEDDWLDPEHIEPEHAPDWTDPETGEVVYAWPDEDAKRRAERRQRRRVAFLQSKGREPGADGDDDFEDEDDDAFDPASLTTDAPRAVEAKVSQASPQSHGDSADTPDVSRDGSESPGEEHGEHPPPTGQAGSGTDATPSRP